MPESQALSLHIHLSINQPAQSPELTILMHLGASGSRCKLSNLLEQINNKIKLQEILT